MPMSWDAAADAKLFTVVMAVYDIKLSGPQNEKIAKLMGEDVTPKAITHRLSKIKAQANTFSHSTPRTPSSRKTSTPNSKTAKTPASSKGKSLLNGSGKVLSATHTITSLMHDNGEDDEEDFETPTKTEPGTRKRKIGVKKPKIEFEGEEDEGMGDAIDFSLGYTGDVKMEEGEVVDLTADINDEAGAQEKSEESVGGKGKGKAKVKQEVVDVEDVYEDEDGEMVV